MESLIALLLVTVSFTIGGMLHSRVLSDAVSMERTRALGMIAEMEAEMELQEEEEWTEKGVRVEREVSTYKGIEGLYRVTYRAYMKRSEEAFLERKELVLEKE